MADIKKLTLLHSNDMHGDFLAESVDEKLIGGVSLLSGYIKKAREQEGSCLFCIAGDMFKGSIIDSEFKGISTIEIMNLLAPDVATVGNHEIDYGIAHLLFLEKCAKFPIINANLFIKTNHARLFAPYKIIECGGLNVMFIGVITEEVLAQTKNEGLIGSFVDVREAAREVGVICDNYKTTKIDLTVLLTHIGFDKDKELAELLDPNYGVDLIIGGHTHTLLEKPCVVNGIPIVQVGVGTDQLGRFDIGYDAEAKRISSLKWKLVQIDSSHCPSDPVIEEMLHSYKSRTDEKYGRTFTTFAHELTHPSRTQETELGNLFADLLQVDSSFDIMFFGSGSIRTEKLGPIVTLGALRECVPYDDPVYMLEANGAQLRRMISYVMRDEAWEGHTEFYQFSKGMRIVWSKSRRELEELKLNGEDIADEKLYKIALQSYHFNSFDEFFGVPRAELEKNRRPRMVITSCNAIFEELLAGMNQVESEIEGRIVIKE
ncbi:MAG: bifunctional UDP-sugar hydrolase/5'-nucleotidase [Oscillospiraceae bacterium]|nr:bifunctional UDP-sugar hydrolase/5'-nucleotidase [Oscillospiraceae bacterium]